MASGAGDREPQESLRQRVDLVIPLIRPGLDENHVIASEPRPDPEKAKGR